MKWEQGEESQNVEDRRGQKMTGLAIGGGSIVVLLIAMFLGVDPKKLQQLLGNAGGQAGQQQQGGGGAPPKDDRARQFSSKIMGFTEKVWGEIFQQAGQRYIPPKLVLFSDAVSTNGCGNAPASAGPFYCPADQTVYLDPTFFDTLESELKGSKADFSQAYVIAHEVGHHVQKLLGYSDLVNEKRAKLPERQFNAWSVRLELQADYLAGVWAHHGQQQFNFLERGDAEEAIKSAKSIGDDVLMKRGGKGWVSPELFTHGSADQRVRAFMAGLKTGDLSQVKAYFDERVPAERL